MCQITGRLWAISDIHLNNAINVEELRKLQRRPKDGLILCGDVGNSLDDLKLAFEILITRFSYVWWTPGNHDLWTSASDGGLRGQARYEKCVEIARSYGVRTPEDPYSLWLGLGTTCIIAPIFTLYDYSFRPHDVPLERALDWAKEDNRLPCNDQYKLHPDPYTSREEWCDALVKRFEKKLKDTYEAYRKTFPLVIAGHWPLRRDLVDLPDRLDRFHMWCGTTKTEDWHTKFNAKVVISGHIHWRRTDWRDNTRFEEVSLGYPRQWEQLRREGVTINDLLREILPGPEQIPPEHHRDTVWLREAELLARLRTIQRPAADQHIERGADQTAEIAGQASQQEAIQSSIPGDGQAAEVVDQPAEAVARPAEAVAQPAEGAARQFREFGADKKARNLRQASPEEIQLPDYDSAFPPRKGEAGSIKEGKRPVQTEDDDWVTEEDDAAETEEEDAGQTETRKIRKKAKSRSKAKAKAKSRLKTT